MERAVKDFERPGHLWPAAGTEGQTNGIRAIYRAAQPLSYIVLAFQLDAASSVEFVVLRYFGELRQGLSLWALLDSNQRPTDYESAALTD